MQLAIATIQDKKSPLRVMPGFGLTLGFTLFYLSLIVLIPLSAVFFRTFTLTWDAFWAAVTSDRVVASYKLTFGASLLAAALSVVFGGIVAWMLVRYRFPDKKIIDALVDLPFALPTAVAGLIYVLLFGVQGWLGPWGCMNMTSRFCLRCRASCWRQFSSLSRLSPAN